MMTLKEVAAACGGVVSDADPDVTVTAVTIDSRTVHPGALFVALAGERTDGHEHVADASARGSAAALVSREVAGPRVTVRDVLRALSELATEVRSRLRARVVAITGSSGKTSAKDLAAAAAGTAREVVANPGSYNNEIGVPLTILAADEGTEVLITEIGARGEGHIAALMPVVRPDIGVVLNVGSAHLGEFGSTEAIARAKAELVALHPDGVAVLNADDPVVSGMRERTAARVVTFGRSAEADVRATEVTLDADGRARFTANVLGVHVGVRMAMVGEHMVPNALAALAIAGELGIDPETAAEGIAGCTGSPGRMRIIDAGGMRIIDDSYNANPESTAAALKALVAIGRGRPTWAVLGEMAELGHASADEHDRMGRLAVRLGVGHLVAVGPAARAIHEAARLEGMFGGESHAVDDVAGAIALLLERAEPDAVVLVKASRAVGLERVAEALAQ